MNQEDGRGLQDFTNFSTEVTWETFPNYRCHISGQTQCVRVSESCTRVYTSLRLHGWIAWAGRPENIQPGHATSCPPPITPMPMCQGRAAGTTDTRGLVPMFLEFQTLFQEEKGERSGAGAQRRGGRSDVEKKGDSEPMLASGVSMWPLTLGREVRETVRRAIAELLM